MSNLAANTGAAIAFTRFGLGARPDDAIPSSPAAWLIGQLAGPDPCPTAGMPSTAAGLAIYAASLAMSHSNGGSGSGLVFQLLGTEQDAAMVNALTTQVPFRERLVWFWANHFAVMAQFAPVACCAGSYIREAIRPHVTGTFKDMLLAVMQHPSMLMSLNNTMSAGPDSTAAKRCATGACSTRGINENLARECLELHTLGVNGGYTQADVDALAMLISGWSVNLSGPPLGFNFNAALHETLPQVLLGRSYAGTQQGGLDALTWLAIQPATYQHLATKLVTHFVSDTPSPSDIATVAAVLSSTGGNLAAAAQAVVCLPSAWVPLTKMRAPQDYTVAVLRAAGATSFTANTANDPGYAAQMLGAPLWSPVFPAGFSDLAADWAGPAQMLLRSDWISTLCTALPTLDPVAIAAATLGPLLRPQTQAAMAAATTVHDRLALLFLSPEFQRR